MAELESLTSGTLVQGVSSDGPDRGGERQVVRRLSIRAHLQDANYWGCRYSPPLPGRRTYPSKLLSAGFRGPLMGTVTSSVSSPRPNASG